MKHSSNIFQSHANSGTIAFCDFSAQSNQEGFDISPGDIGSLGLFKNGFKSFAVFAIHTIIISETDTVIKRVF